ncbi:MAG TPA: hypothetical protein VFH36_13125 [Acidimicrobiales bacterium]|nr:hypothetical protein [Acidimicrobiales bacterium]
MSGGRRAAMALAAPALAGLLAASVGCTDDDDPAADVDMSELRDGLEDELRTTIAAVLYENPGSRADLLADVPTDEPELWAEINADGEVTLEEFSRVHVVANAVLTHSNDVVRYFEEEAVRQAEAGD